MDKTNAETARLLLTVAPDVFANDIFAMKGGTAINLFVWDMPRMSIDIDVVYIRTDATRDQALQEIAAHNWGSLPIGCIASDCRHGWSAPRI